MKRLLSKGKTAIVGDRGAVLTWAIVILLVLVILVGAVLTLSLAYYTRVVNDNASKQAFLTARSAAQAIASEICANDGGANAQKILSKIPHNGNSFRIDNIGFSGNEGKMGNCVAVLKREGYKGSDSILITATATVGTQEKSVSLRLEYQEKTTEVFEQMVLNPSSNGNMGITPYNGLQTDSKTDIYIGEDARKFEINITDNGNSPVLMGNLYSGVPVFINSAYYNNSHVHGDIISDKNITINQNSSVGPYANCCGGTKTQSEIYTIGIVTANNDSRIYSKITAQTVVLNNQTKVFHDITADSVQIKDNAVIEGNVTANTLTITGQGRITGSVTAGTLILKDNAKIVGNVITTTITLDNGGKIEGSVTAKSVITSGSWQNPMITNNLTVQNAISSNIKVGGTVYSGVLYTQTPTPVSALSSRMPPTPSAPVFPKLSDSENGSTNFNNPNLTLGRTDGKDSYYTVNGNLNVSTLYTQGEGNVFIFVQSGASFLLNQMATIRKEHPNVFVIVENGAAFKRTNIQADSYMDKSQYKDFYGYIMAKESATVYIGRGTHIYGGISAINAEIRPDVSISYVPLPKKSGGTGSTGGSGGSGSSSETGSSGGSGSSGGTESATESYWSVLQYEQTQ